MKVQPVIASANFEIFRVYGDLNGDNTQQCMVSMESFSRAPARSLILDMAPVALVNRAIIDLVVQIAHLCRRRRVRLYLANLTPAVQDILGMLCLTNLFTMTDTVQEAIERAS